MDINVGAYALNGTFESKEHAKKVFLEHFPSVTDKDLDIELGKLFKNGNQSNNATQPIANSDKQHTDVGKGSVREKSTRKD